MVSNEGVLATSTHPLLVPGAERIISRDYTTSEDTPLRIPFKINGSIHADQIFEFEIIPETSNASDFSDLQGQIRVPAGQRVILFVPIRPDSIPEPTETARMIVRNPTHPNQNTEYRITILNDDSPSLTVNEIQVTEGSGGLHWVEVAVNLSAPTPSRLNIPLRWGGGTAKAGDDYLIGPQLIEIPANKSKGTIRFPVFADLKVETSETVEIELLRSNGVNLADTLIQIKIVDDDTPQNAWHLSDVDSRIDSLLTFSKTVSTAELTEVNSAGWTLRFIARVQQIFEGPPSVSFSFGNGATLAKTTLSLDTQGNLVAGFNGSGTSHQLTQNGIGARDYHVHQVTFNPINPNTPLVYSFNGIEQTSWNGSASPQDAGAVRWGVSSGPGRGELSLRLLEFSSSQSGLLLDYQTGAPADPVSPGDPFLQGWSRDGSNTGITERAINKDPESPRFVAIPRRIFAHSAGRTADPIAIAEAPDGTLYVTSGLHDRVQAFAPDGRFLFQLPTPRNAQTRLNEPNGIAVNSLGQIIVSNQSDNRILILERDGTLLRSLGGNGAGPGQFSGANAIEIDSKDNLFIADRFNHRIQVLNSNGNFVRSFGQEGTSDGQFRFPNAIAIEGTGTGSIFVTDSGNNRIQVFAQDGTFLRTFGSSGTGAGQLANPSGLAFDSNGNLLVSDSGNHRIQFFSPDGTYLRSFGSFGHENDNFNVPEELIIGQNGNVFVADRHHERVKRFRSDGTFLGLIGQPGDQFGYLERPTGLAVSPAKKVYVADPANSRVLVFDEHGAFLTTFGRRGLNKGEFLNPEAIETDSKGRVFVTDTSGNHIQIFDADHNFIGRFGSPGSGDGQFSAPLDLAFEPTGTILVVDNRNHRIQRFDPSGVFIDQFGSQGAAEGQFSFPRSISTFQNGNLAVTDTGNNRVQLFTPDGSFIRTITGPATGIGAISNPRGLAIDPFDRIFITDLSKNPIKVFSQDGVLLRMLGARGQQLGEFMEASQLAISPTGKIYIVDHRNNHVQLWDYGLCFDHSGDVNCDGKLNVLDLVRTQTHISGNTLSLEQARIADSDASGTVNRTDANRIIDQLFQP